MHVEVNLSEESLSVWTSSQRYYVKRFYAKWRLQTRYEEMLNGLALSQELREKGFPARVCLYFYIRNGLPMTKERRTKQMNGSTGGSYHLGELPLREAKAIGELLAHFHRLLDLLFPEHQQVSG
ncbi:hypothetical protein [Brevibacillus brevis]|uniref:hypothetical protein n=1 Tax=Brevibacillus brevis TaxID=1393 RepID=UPI0037CCB43F